MPVIPYYQGRPAHLWISAMALKRGRNTAWSATQLSDLEQEKAYQALVHHLSDVPLAEFTSSMERIEDSLLAGLSDPVSRDRA